MNHSANSGCLATGFQPTLLDRQISGACRSRRHKYRSRTGSFRLLASRRESFHQIQWEQKLLATWIAQRFWHHKREVPRMHQFDHNQQHPELFSKYSQHTQSGDAGTDLMATETAWRLWQVMGKSNRWTQKNGAEPTALWIAQIGSMTEPDQTGLSAMHGTLRSG
jgi:hypothetical protein